jgi:cytochrome b561
MFETLRYHPFAILLHWLIAALIVAAFALGVLTAVGALALMGRLDD